jgi:hypothetical protein
MVAHRAPNCRFIKYMITWVDDWLIEELIRKSKVMGNKMGKEYHT